jgi:hypothetical protein
MHYKSMHMKYKTEQTKIYHLKVHTQIINLKQSKNQGKYIQ